MELPALRAKMIHSSIACRKPSFHPSKRTMEREPLRRCDISVGGASFIQVLQISILRCLNSAYVMSDFFSGNHTLSTISVYI